MSENRDFLFQAQQARVVFGDNSLQHLEREISALGAQRALVLCTAEQRQGAEDIMLRLGRRAAGLFDQATMHVPIEVARAARARAQECGADCAIAFGGGSTIGLGKAIALESGLPILAIPTTYAGSEMTPIYGITEDGIKRTGRDLRVLPKTVIYDPGLTLSLPIELSVLSGINAIAHAAEGLYAQDANPVMSLIAEEGIRRLAAALPAIYANSGEPAARHSALCGAWLCGMVLGNVGMALHHKLCHTLGGSFNLPHAQTHTVILPHALAYNAKCAPDAMSRIAGALGVSDAAKGIYNLARDHGAPVSLKEIGMKRGELARAVELACTHPYWNPRSVDRAGLTKLLSNAFEGVPPCE